MWDYRGFQRGDWAAKGFPLCDGLPAGPSFPHNEWQAPIDVPAQVTGVEDEDLGLYALNGGCSQVGLKRDNHTWYADFDMVGCTNLSAAWRGRNYTLQQIHFHVESENMVAGHHMDMEVHMVHTALDGSSLVIGLFVERSPHVSKQNQMLDDLLELQFSPENIATGLFDNPYRDMLKSGDAFYSFLGSLTTPPCTPNLEWVLLRDPVYVAPKDFARFEQFLQTSASQADSEGHDDRPVQPLNGRPVKLGKVGLLA